MSDATRSGRPSPRRGLPGAIRKSARALVVALLLAGLLAGSAGAQSSDFEEFDSGPKPQTGTDRVVLSTVDVLITRPLATAALCIGTVYWMASVTVLMTVRTVPVWFVTQEWDPGYYDEATQNMVLDPFYFTFQRPIGEFNP